MAQVLIAIALNYIFEDLIHLLPICFYISNDLSITPPFVIIAIKIETWPGFAATSAVLA